MDRDVNISCGNCFFLHENKRMTKELADCCKVLY